MRERLEMVGGNFTVIVHTGQRHDTSLRKFL